MAQPHLKRFLLKRDAVVSILIFGILTMVADFFGDMDLKKAAVSFRVLGILLLFAILIYDYLIGKRRELFAVPLILSEYQDQQYNRSSFSRFLASVDLDRSARDVDELSSVKKDDLIISLSVASPRKSPKAGTWKRAWQDLVKKWQRNVDLPLAGTLLSNEARCYHILNDLPLPLAFAMGASVNWRRPIVLYNKQEDNKFFKVFDLKDPRVVLDIARGSTNELNKSPEDFASLCRFDRLIIYFFISPDKQPEFRLHPDHEQSADSAALFYKCRLGPHDNWLAHVNRMVNEASPLIQKYSEIDVVLNCPVPVAFALGMALARKPKIKVCEFLAEGKYVPVFSLAEIERNIPFT